MDRFKNGKSDQAPKAIIKNAEEENENLDHFVKWLEEDPVDPLSIFVKESGDKEGIFANKDDKYNGGYNHRSRVFVNSNKSYNNKNTDKEKENSKNPKVHSAYENSWDRPIRKGDSKKVYITDTNFYNSIKDSSKSSQQDSKCLHNIVHTSCNCTSTCTMGVCTNCYLVFCDSPCLQIGLSAGGKISYASKSHLEGSFGISDKGKRYHKQNSPRNSEEKFQNSKGSSSRHDSSPKSSSDTSGYETGRGRGSSHKEKEKYQNSSSDQDKKSYNNRPNPTTGVFRKTHGYQPGFSENLAASMSAMQLESFHNTHVPRETVFEIGRPGHYERNIDNSYGAGRGRGINPNYIVNKFNVPSRPSLGRGKQKGLFDIQPEPEKILRDPLAMYYGTNPDPPPYRGGGRGRGSNFHKKSKEEPIPAFDVGEPTSTSKAGGNVKKGKDSTEISKYSKADFEDQKTDNNENKSELKVNNHRNDNSRNSDNNNKQEKGTGPKADAKSNQNKKREGGAQNIQHIPSSSLTGETPSKEQDLSTTSLESSNKSKSKETLFEERLSSAALSSFNWEDQIQELKIHEKINSPKSLEPKVEVGQLKKVLKKSKPVKQPVAVNSVPVKSVQINPDPANRVLVDPVPISQMGPETACTTTSLLVGSKHPVRICGKPVNANDFCIMLNKHEDIWNEIQGLTDRAVSFGLNPYMVNLVGKNFYQHSLCMVMHPQTKKYYRGMVCCIDTFNLAEVRLIDTGQIMNVPANELLEMPPMLTEKQPLAHHCSLPILPREGFVDDLMDRFNKLNELYAKDDGLVARIYAIKGYTYIIDLMFVRESTTLVTALLAVDQATMLCDQAVLTKFDKDSELDQYSEINNHFRMLMTLQGPRVVAEKKEETSKLSAEDSEEIASLHEFVMGSTSTEKTSIFNFQRLPQLQDISELNGIVCMFNRLIGFNVFLIMKKGYGPGMLEFLESKIAEWVSADDGKNGEFQPGETPQKDDIVLALIGGSVYRRAKVENIDGRNAKIRYVDFGTVMSLPISLLRKPSDEIMTIPLFVHFVQLVGVRDDAPILIDDFRKLRTELKGEIVVGPQIKAITSKLPMVYMFVDENKKKQLTTLINNLAVWRWQKLYRVMFTDYNEQLEVYSHQYRNVLGFFEKCTITDAIKRATLMLKVRRVALVKDKIMVSGLPVDSSISYQSRTLNLQLSSFCTKVSSELININSINKLGHLMCIKLNEERIKADKYPTSCIWHRCYYNSLTDLISCIDCFWETSAHLEKKSKPGELIIRPLSPDFYNACPIGMICSLQGDLDPIKFCKTIPIGRIIKVNIFSRTPKVENDICFYDASLNDSGID